MRTALDLTLPHVLGAEFSGIVHEVVQGVTDLHLGDAVFGPASGTYATHTLATAASLQRKPENLSWEQAASLPLAAVTAFRALQELKLGPGETLLVHGAAGSVVSMAVRRSSTTQLPIFNDDAGDTWLDPIAVQFCGGRKQEN
jgi:NADPH:quinone reductase-like Zn-dependent oxidoreductase